MCWYVEPDRPLSELAEMTQEQRDSLTWEEAVGFIAPDTLELASWYHLHKHKDYTPFTAVLRHYSISEERLNAMRNIA